MKRDVAQVHRLTMSCHRGLRIEKLESASSRHGSVEAPLSIHSLRGQQSVYVLCETVLLCDQRSKGQHCLEVSM